MLRFAEPLPGRPAGPGTPDISLLAPRLQREWDAEANAHLGEVVVKPKARIMVHWRGGICKTGEPHRWTARLDHRSRGHGDPFEAGTRVCPHCNSLAANFPALAEQWDRAVDCGKTPDTVTPGSHFQAPWKCPDCGHSWRAAVGARTCTKNRTGCPACGKSRQRCRQPTIANGPSHLFREFDHARNNACGLYAESITLGSGKKVAWIKLDECPKGRPHAWLAAPFARHGQGEGSPFSRGHAACVCNCLAELFPDVAQLWDHAANPGVTPHDVPAQSNKRRHWLMPDGSRKFISPGQMVTMWRRRQKSKPGAQPHPDEGS